MPLFKGSLTVTRFRVRSGTIPDTNPFPWEDIENAISENAFQPAASMTSVEVRSGWSDIFDPLSTDFTRRDAWAFNNYVALGVRVEQKKVPGKLFTATLRRRISAWCREHQRERCPATVREEIREGLREEMLRHVLPTLKHHEVLWSMNEGHVLVLGTSVDLLDRVRKLIPRTFATITPDGPLEWLPASQARALLDIGATSFQADASDTTPDSLARDHEDDDVLEEEETLLPPPVLADFLTWLWYVTEENDGRVDIGDKSVQIWVDERLVFRDTGETSSSVSICTSDPSRAREAKIALLSGRVPKEMRLEIRIEDRSYNATLHGHDLALSTAKLPGLVKGGDPAEILYERMFLYEELHWVLTALFRQFSELRTSSAWWNTAVPAMRAWVKEGSKPDPVS